MEALRGLLEAPPKSICSPPVNKCIRPYGDGRIRRVNEDSSTNCKQGPIGNLLHDSPCAIKSLETSQEAKKQLVTISLGEHEVKLGGKIVKEHLGGLKVPNSGAEWTLVGFLASSMRKLPQLGL